MKYLTLFLLCCLPFSGHASTYKSLHGFDIALPVDWMLVNRQTSGDAQRTSLQSLGVAGAFASAEKLKSAEDKIAAGKSEYYFRTGDSPGGFVDNVNLQLVQAVQGNRVCLNLEQELRHFYDEQIDVTGCVQQETGHVIVLSYRYIKPSDRLAYYQTEYQLTPTVVMLAAATSGARDTTETEQVLALVGDAITGYFRDYPSFQATVSDHLAGEEYTKAAVLLNKLAAVGDQHAEYDLGLMYESGYGVEVDYARAHEYYERAAAKGNMLAVTNLAGLYFNGSGLAKDPARAAQLYRSAAESGVTVAQTNYAGMLIKGVGVEPDPKAAIDWYLKAALAGEQQAGRILVALYKAEAQAGNVEALRMLAAIHLEGAGVPKNILMGLQYLEQAAAANSIRAKELLSTIYAQGLYGIRPDADKAKFWKNS